MKGKKTTKPKAARKPRVTLRTDCEAVGAALPAAEGELLERIVALAGKSLNTNLGNSVRTYPDGTHICLCCGFPAPAAFSTCPNCGHELTPADGKLIRKGSGIQWISVFTKRKGALGSYVIQRQFTVDVRLDTYPCQHIKYAIHEVYRNFVAEDGRLITFKRGLNAFPYTCINPFNTNSTLKYYPRSDRYPTTCPPCYCDLGWDEAVNERLYKEIRRRFDIFRNKLNNQSPQQCP